MSRIKANNERIRQISTYLAEENANELVGIAASQQKSVSSLVRELVNQFLQARWHEAARKQH